MKIMFVDNNINGHHVPYLTELIKLKMDYICFLPDVITEIPIDRQIVRKYQYKNLFGYMRWIKEIIRIANKENIDIIHFLYGDILYRFFGIGLIFFKKYKLMVTFHHFRKGYLRDISLKRIFKRIGVGIVHTDALKNYAKARNISNLEVVVYPVFEELRDFGKHESCLKLGFSEQIKTILCFGGTRKDKGIDILLEALRHVRQPIQIIIAGKAEYFSEKFIITKLQELQISYIADLKYITNEYVSLYFSACDIVVLPYRLIFDGASGPLGIGCFLKKTIIGPSHGSIGNIIVENHLGYVFESENVNSLAETMTNAINDSFIYDDYAQSYRSKLDVNNFSISYDQIYRKLLSY